MSKLDVVIFIHSKGKNGVVTGKLDNKIIQLLYNRQKFNAFNKNLLLLPHAASFLFSKTERGAI